VTDAAARTLEVTLVPDLAEHLRARREMARLTPIGDPRGALAWLVALFILSGLITEVADGGEWWGVLRGLPLLMFFLGVGLAMRRGQGRPLTWVMDDDGVEVRQPRHRFRVPWERVRRVAETDEFFLVVTGGAVFYLPKRALRGADAEAELRVRLRGVTGS